MTYTLAAVMAVTLSAGIQASDPVLTGDYVEARTAEVFTGGCIMGSEGEVSGREAIMAWRVNQGSMYGVPLDGLAVVAVVAGDRNLGTHELGGPRASLVKSIVMTDERANPAQQQALVALARTMAPELVKDVVATRKTPITFRVDGDTFQVSAGAAKLDTTTKLEHSLECGAAKWFSPLAPTQGAQVGMTRSQEWSGDELGAQWKQMNRKSSYIGTFTLGR
jgi:hypothetical protein